MATAFPVLRVRIRPRPVAARRSALRLHAVSCLPLLDDADEKGVRAMSRDPLATTAVVAAARVLGRDCMVTLFVTEAELDAVTRMVCDVMGVQTDKVHYSPPTATRDTPCYSWNEDSDGRRVYVTVHVLPATANDNATKEGA